MDVGSEALCQTAAMAMGFEYAGAVSYASYPGGCFQFNGQGGWDSDHSKIFYNQDQTIAVVRDHVRLICRDAFLITSAERQDGAHACLAKNGMAGITQEECRGAAEALGHVYGAQDDL